MIGIFISINSLILDKLPKIENEVIFVIQVVVVFAISFYMAHLIGMGKAKLILNDEGITHVWERRFLLSREKNYNIPWSIVDNYVFQEDRTFDSFIINLTNQTRYKVNRLNILPNKDDFNRLVKEFPRLSNEFKNGNDLSLGTKSIKEGVSIYARKSFRWVFYFMSAGFLILVLTKVFNPDSETKWSMLGVIGSGILFYGLMVKGQKRSKDANQQESR